MSKRRAMIGLVVLVGFVLVGRVPAQSPTQPIPTTKKPQPIRTAQIPGDEIEPGPLDFQGLPGTELDCQPPGFVPAPGFIPNPVGDDDCAGIADPPAPQVRIKVRVPAIAAAGKELEYRMVVENTGRGAAHRSLVRVTLPNGARLVRAVPEATTTDPEPRWQLGTLPPCGSREITLIVVPGEGDQRLCARVSHEYGQCVVTRIAGKIPMGPDTRVVPIPGPNPVPQPPIPVPNPMPLPQPPMPMPMPVPMPMPPMGNPELQIKVTAPATGMLYEPATFLIDVTNNGTGPANDVTVIATPTGKWDFSNAKPAEVRNDPLTWTIKTIAPRQRQRIELLLIPKASGSLVLDAEASDSSGGRKSDRGQIVIREVKLGLVMQGPSTRLLASTAIYSIQVTNTGDVEARNVIVVDDIPKQIEVVRISDNGKAGPVAIVNPEDPPVQVRWEVGRLMPRESKTVQIEIRSKEAGKLINRATARNDQMERPVRAEAATNFTNVTGVTIEVERDASVIEVGKANGYTIRVINQGDGVVEALGVAVALPKELALVQAKGPIEALKGDGSLVTFPPEVRLEPRGKAEYRIEVTAVMPGTVKLRTEVISRQLTAPLIVEESTTILPKP